MKINVIVYGKLIEFLLAVGFILNVVLSNVIAFLIMQLFTNKDLSVTRISFKWGIPWNVTGQIKELNIITYLFPHRYTLNLIQASWFGLSSDMSFPNVDPNSWLGIHSFDYGGIGWALPAAISCVWIVFFFGTFIILNNKDHPITLKTRKYRHLSKYRYHKNNIEKIKHSNTLLELEEQVFLIKAEHRKNSRYKLLKKIKLTKHQRGPN